MAPRAVADTDANAATEATSGHRPALVAPTTSETLRAARDAALAALQLADLADESLVESDSDCSAGEIAGNVLRLSSGACLEAVLA